MKDIEKIINEVNGTMTMEGMPLTVEDRDRIRTCLRDNKQFEETLRNLILKHTVLNSVKNYEQRL